MTEQRQIAALAMNRILAEGTMPKWVSVNENQQNYRTGKLRNSVITRLRKGKQ